MSYADDCEDIGGWYAEQDFYAEECADNDGECSKCPHRRRCSSSDYNQARRERWR